MRLFWIAACALGAGACSQSEQANGNADAAAEEPTSAPVANYDQKEGNNYLYIGALSDADQEAGKKAPDVSTFRYAGEKDGVHTLQSINGDDTVAGTIACTNPCKIVTLKFGEETERVGYGPDSVMGVALQDAFNGHLQSSAK